MSSTVKTLSEYFIKCEKDGVGQLAFPSRPDQSAAFKYYTCKEVNRLALRAAAYYLKHGLNPSAGGSPIVGISSAGTIEWVASFVALSNLGYTILALSPNLSNDRRDKLLENAGTTALITDQSHCSSSLLGSIKIIQTIPEAQLTSHDSFDEELIHSQILTAKAADTAFILHSSGSTGLPKLFPIDQQDALTRIVSFKALPYGCTRLYISSAVYHAAGLVIFLMALDKTLPTFFYNDRLPWSGQGLVEFLTEAQVDFAGLTPACLETIAQGDGGIKILENIAEVGIFGAVPPQQLCTRLAKAGGRIQTTFAMSETGPLMASSMRPAGDLDWDFMSVIPQAKPHLWMKPMKNHTNGAERAEEDQLYECVILKGYPDCPARFSNSDDPPGSFYTGDVFLKHPTKPDRWKLLGRKDDQINMAMPVVINALEYESVIKNGSPAAVEEVVVVGQGRKKLAVLIFVVAGTIISTVREAIWHVVEEKINSTMTVGIDPDMIVVLEGEIPRTDKGNFMRVTVNIRYKEIIDQLYDEKEGDKRPL